jgi:hypothetical protein
MPTSTLAFALLAGVAMATYSIFLLQREGL